MAKHTDISRKLGFPGLVALVFGLVVGLGIFNLPQNMAHSSSVGAVAVAWLISGAGILTLVIAFKILSDRFPDYNAGIYEYAQAGYGQYTGFNVAWGYWLCTAFSNVAYAVMLNDAVGAFFPRLLDHGWETVLFGSVFIWIMFFIVGAGIQTAKIINTSLAVVKVCLLILIIVIFFTKLDIRMLTVDLWGEHENLGSVGEQIKNSMMVTLFCFFGVEGAVMLSARARNTQDVGRAGVVGFLVSLVLYILVSVLCFGLMSRTELSQLPDPSVAYILRDFLGDWAYYFVIGAVIIALLGGWVAWTLVVAQVPFEAARVRILPRIFLKTNKNNMPTFGLFASSVVMELFLLMVVTADNVYLAALHITGLMILPCYLYTAMFLYKTADTAGIKILAAVSVLFCCWMIYAGGIVQMLMTSIFYLAGVGFFIIARKENDFGNKPIFSKRALIELVVLCIAAIITVFLFFNGGIEF